MRHPTRDPLPGIRRWAKCPAGLVRLLQDGRIDPAAAILALATECIRWGGGRTSVPSLAATIQASPRHTYRVLAAAREQGWLSATPGPPDWSPLWSTCRAMAPTLEGKPDALTVTPTSLRSDSHVTTSDSHVTTSDSHVTECDSHVTTGGGREENRDLETPTRMPARMCEILERHQPPKAGRPEASKEESKP